MRNEEVVNKLLKFAPRRGQLILGGSAHGIPQLHFQRFLLCGLLLLPRTRLSHPKKCRGIVRGGEQSLASRRQPECALPGDYTHDVEGSRFRVFGDESRR